MNRRILLSLALAALSVQISAAELALGAAAPNFEAKDQDGKAITSSELYKSGTTLFFFYPKAGTGG